MKTVVLTIGPRGAGKTTFCREVVQRRPEVHFVERDAILVELFGSATLSPYMGEHERGFQEMMNRVKALLCQESVTIVLDTWLEIPDHRRQFIACLRILGAERIVGWHFVTSEERVVRQFLARESTPTSPWRHANGKAVLRECRRYRSYPVELDQGFDHLVEIDPVQPSLLPIGYGLL